MPDPIVVSESHHFTKIAAEAGYYDWMTLWARNGTLEGTGRTSPLRIFHGDKTPTPGDTVEVPELRRKDIEKAADNEAAHKFTVKRSKVFLRLRVLDENSRPLPGAATWVLFLDGVRYPTEGPGEFEDGGRINVEVRPTASVGKLVVTYTPPMQLPQPTFPPPDQEPIDVQFQLSVGRLDPIQEPAPNDDCWAGVQQRLNNLGYGSGVVDGKDNDRAKAAIRRFQRKYTPGTVNGQPADVQARLHTYHDTPADIPAN